MSSTGSSSHTSRKKGLNLQEGTEIYDCGVREVLWTSWTDGNPGTRFYGCRNYSPPRERVPKKGCEHFVWFDRKMSMRAKEVINQLKNEKKLLLKEKREQGQRCDCSCKDDFGCQRCDCSCKDDFGYELEQMSISLNELKMLNNVDMERRKKKLFRAYLAITCLLIVLVVSLNT